MSNHINTETAGASSPTIKERPVLMTGPLVTAALEGIKTQTRRVIKPQPQPFVAKDSPGPFWHIAFAGWPEGRIRQDHMGPMLENLCPYGRVGDRLWIRETFTYGYTGDYVIFKDGAQKYRAEYYYPGLAEYQPGAFDDIKWKPSIHMPRWASRLTLEITGIRAERVQDISQEDIRAEGVDVTMRNEANMTWQASPTISRERRFAKDRFAALWNSVNGKKPGFAWADNCWVWVLEFRGVKGGVK